ncbi:hypothetical protein [Pseudomonas sp. ADAK13]|uniref:hypothetical protein n=1 Tax=Pseudomonas sp. ADAK13 TaxID=2730847 RepID=UPI00146364DE|nr:hypothetical protein [Pseudomonas sp. ADAK13]QJI38232.1 hypothetical protein HKK54_28810 [Pseudomonas sp. ADAK13]
MTVRALGKSFKNVNINNPFIAYPLIAPGDNPNGVILRTLYASGNVIISTTTPPASADNYVKYPIIPSSRTQYDDLLIPAGSGVFVYFTNQYANTVQMSWDVLNADGTVA